MDSLTLAYYNQNAIKVAQRYESANVTQLHEFLSSSLKPGGSLLELGCGSGRDAAFMSDQGFRVLATDGSAAMLEQVKQHHPQLAAHVGQLQLPGELSSELGTFDGIYAIAVLMHLSVQDIAKTISAVESLLTPKGRFAFSVSILRNDVTTDEFDAKGRRFTILSPDKWQELCQKSGLQMTRTMMSEDALERDTVTWMNCLAEKPTTRL